LRDLAIALSGLLLVHLFPERRPAAVKPMPAVLGSLSRPVRACSAADQARYLARLRGPDGSVPTCRQVPMVGFGVYDDFLDLFEVTCDGRTVQVFMDRCFDLHSDVNPIPGFTMVGWPA
jgi:hypothetical protein